jgi:diacylglycerol kinase family enzyme
VPRFISRYGDGRRLRVVSTEALPIQIDGDFLGYVTEVAVEVLPAAVRIIVPRTKLSA